MGSPRSIIKYYYAFFYSGDIIKINVLTPSTVLSVCLGDEIVINCYEPESTANMRISLRWEIAPINELLPTIELPLSDLMNNTNRQEYESEFHAELVSYSPLRAILTTIAHSALDGATVTCTSAGSGSISSDFLIIRVNQIGK